ncbi:DUF2969 domain-containing protein [Companilactobacillus mishanensis]|uniref:DUF2969 domain-containing protein n=1 Tax=Companilactobacillus mishanensis TaxID=2486008 RepID=A0A5P0ZGV6_9LACO|nr:DUF2969 domain-containing protein [Companilactobacillus mishanensis]MQS44023.1 DUF2969 domain-containing protein [Companilactobacillus mishanensis]MQS52232.1 DUF2969 domain-containing protein [Companilactobacillus mishanensis]MQS88322.1 DUF2969 domain-containing protein [Companilactobacillus mishanensis]
MAKKNKPIEINLKDISDDPETYELWDGKKYIGTIRKEGDRFLSFVDSKDTPFKSVKLDDAINELLMQYNLHNH